MQPSGADSAPAGFRPAIGTTTWTTSIFPGSQGDYVLPVKRPVRAAEGLDVGDMATVTVELIDFG